ncbi:hypothetical protein BH20ACT6_BH20ACT6_24280 [soil metagenome]
MTDRTNAGAAVSLLARIRRLWETLDPAPDDLADRVLFALELEDLDTEFELLRLTERTDALAGTRAAARRTASTVTHITFAGENLSVMLAVGPDGSTPPDPEGRRIDGWIAPASAARVVAHTDTGECETTADETGRFVLETVPAGMLRLLLFPRRVGAGGSEEPLVPFVTPTVEV